MENNQIEVKHAKIVKDPRLSLTQYSRYPGSTLNNRMKILVSSKYPGEYIPRIYDIARGIITATFSANFDDYELYFDEFRRQAARLKREAIAFSPKTDNYKNRYYSAGALEGLIKMSGKIIPILKKYVLNSNTKRAAIVVEGVKVSSKADMLLFDQAGELVGLLRLNFPQAKLKVNEAELALQILREYSKENDGIEFNSTNCLFIDIYSGSVITAQDSQKVHTLLVNTCREIKSIWQTV